MTEIWLQSLSHLGLVPFRADGGGTGVMPGLIGLLQANETIKVLSAIGESLDVRLLLWMACPRVSLRCLCSGDPIALPSQPRWTMGRSVASRILAVLRERQACEAFP